MDEQKDWLVLSHLNHHGFFMPSNYMTKAQALAQARAWVDALLAQGRVNEASLVRLVKVQLLPHFQEEADGRVTVTFEIPAQAKEHQVG